MTDAETRLAADRANRNAARKLVEIRDSFSAEHEALVMARFGPTPPARWPRSEAHYRSQGLRA